MPTVPIRDGSVIRGSGKENPRPSKRPERAGELARPGGLPGGRMDSDRRTISLGNHMGKENRCYPAYSGILRHRYSQFATVGFPGSALHGHMACFGVLRRPSMALLLIAT